MTTCAESMYGCRGWLITEKSPAGFMRYFIAANTIPVSAVSTTQTCR